MKILVFSDLHLHTWKTFGFNSDVGMPRRLLDQVNVLEQIKSYIEENKIKLVIFGGDAYHKVGEVPVECINILSEFFKWLVDNGVSYMLVNGNHDLVDRESPEWFESAVNSFKYVVPDSGVKIKLINYNDVPSEDWFDNDLVVAHKQPCIVNEYGHKFPGVDYGFMAEHNRFVLFGHYHKHTVLSNNCFIVGSPLALTFGDTDQRGFYVFDTDGMKTGLKGEYEVVNDWAVSFVPTKYPKFITVENPSDVKDDGNYYRVLNATKKIENQNVLTVVQPVVFDERIKSSDFNSIVREWLSINGKQESELESIKDIISEKLNLAKTFFDGVITDISIKDFMSFGDVSITVEPGFNLVSGSNLDGLSSNGTGKCIAEHSEITMHDGSTKLIENVAVGDTVACLDGKLKINKSKIVATSKNKQECYRVKLRDGRTITASSNHPLLTINGWNKLSNINVGEKIATPRVLPTTLNNCISENESELVGMFLGDGCTVGTPNITVGCYERSLIRRFKFLVKNFDKRLRFSNYRNARSKSLTITVSLDKKLVNFGLRKSSTKTSNIGKYVESCGHTVVGKFPAGKNKMLVKCPNGHAYRINKSNFISGRRCPRCLKNPLTVFLKNVGIYGLTGHNKRVPDCIVNGSFDVIVACLRGLFATDGSISVGGVGNGRKGRIDINFVNKSRVMAYQVQSMLLKIGVLSKVRFRNMLCTTSGKRFPSYSVEVITIDSRKRFLQTVGDYDSKLVKKLLDLINKIENTTFRSNNLDLIPGGVWRHINNSRTNANRSWSAILPSCINKNITQYYPRMRDTSRKIVGCIGSSLHDEFLVKLSKSDIFWDEIVSITKVGRKTTYDLQTESVGGQEPNFISDNVFVHNSSLFESVFWCFFGETTKGLTGNDVIRRGEKDCKVDVNLKSNKTFYSVSRSRKRGLQVFDSNQVEITDGMLEKDKQKLLEDSVLGFDRNVYMASCYFSQENMTVLTGLSDVDKTNMITSLLGFEVYDDLYSKTFDKLKKVKSKSEESFIKLHSLKSEISILEDNIKNVESYVNNDETEIKRAESDVEIANINISDIENQISKIEEVKSVIDYGSEIDRVKSELKSKLGDIETWYSSSMAEIEPRYSKMILSSVSDLKSDSGNRLSECKLEISKLNSSYSNLKLEYDSISSDIKSNNFKLSSNEAEIEKLKSQIADLESSRFGEKCDKCGSLITNENTSIFIGEKEASISLLKVSNDDLNSKLEALNSKLAEVSVSLEDYKSRISAIELEVQSLNSKMLEEEKKRSSVLMEINNKKYSEIDGIRELKNSKVSEVRLDYNERESKLVSLKHAQDDAINSVNSLRSSLKSKLEYCLSQLSKDCQRLVSMKDARDKRVSDLKSLKSKFDSINLEISNRNSELESSYSLINSLEFWQKSFSSSGIRALLLDGFCNGFNSIVNDYLSTASNGTMSITVTPTKTTKSGEERNKLGMDINLNDSTVGYNSLSGGEKRRVDFSVCLALNKWISNKYGVNGGLLGIVVFDELFSYLDRSGEESIATLLYNESRNKSIYVISHTADLGSYTDRNITVVKEYGKSRIQL